MQPPSVEAILTEEDGDMRRLVVALHFLNATGNADVNP
jgi:hypothetical protein